jgi:capsid protein
MPDLARLEDGLRPDQRLTIVDRVVGFFNPVQKLVRMKAREIEHQFSFGYNDVPHQRTPSGGLWGQASAETWRSNRDRLKSMWDARDLCRFEFVGGMMARVVLYVCGKFHSRSLTGEEEIDQAYDDYWKGWCGDQPNDDGTLRCDITGRHRFGKMVQMSFLGFLIDGDHGFIEVDPQLSPTGEFCLQSIEADRIGSPLDQQVQENYIGGISLDPITGRIASYRIYRRTRTNQYLDPQEIPFAAFVHLFDADSSDQYRGRTKLLRLLNDARDIREWVEAEKIAGKTQSQWAAMVGLRDPFPGGSGPSAWGNKTPEGTPTQPAEWGKILKLAEGEVFNMMAPAARPSGAFMAFTEMLIRKMAVSLDLPYGFLWDLATLGGVTARIEVQQALRRIEYWQELLKIKVLNRVRQKVIAQGIANQLLPPHPLWQKVEWHFGNSIQTDVGYDMDSDIAATQHGIAKISDITAKYGKSPREVFVSNAQTASEAIQVGTEFSLPVESFAAGLFPMLTDQRAAFVSGPVPPPPPGSFEAIGDKGVKQLVDILTAVGDGKLDPDSAKETLKRVFHIPEKIAENMVPEPDLGIIKALHPKPAAPAGGNGSKAQNKRVSKPKKAAARK